MIPFVVQALCTFEPLVIFTDLHLVFSLTLLLIKPCPVVQSVMCLAAGMCLTADPGVASLMPAWSHTFVEIDHEIISSVILLPSAYSRRVVVSYKLKYMHKVLVNCLVKLAQEKSVVRLTDYSDMTIAINWDVKTHVYL